MISQNAGTFFGRTLLQQTGSVGGHRFVFVKLQGGAKNELVHPTSGFRIKNPFLGIAKIYAGDLVEYRMDGTGYLYKTYEVAAASLANATTIKITRDGYKHKPFIGDKIMLAPSKLDGYGTYATVTAVSETTASNKDVWALTISGAIGALAVGDVLIEAKAAVKADADVELLAVGAAAPATCAIGEKYFNTSSKKVFVATAADTWAQTGTDPEAGVIYYSLGDEKFYQLSGDTLAAFSAAFGLVQNPNMQVPCDFDFLYNPASGENEVNGARYGLTPVFPMITYLSRMQPLPQSVKDLNKSRVVGWFEL